MKIQRIPILVIITCVFAAFIAGFFAGRNVNRTPVQVSTIAVSSPADEAAATEQTEPPLDQIININTADLDALQTLPGIGPVLAQRIIDYRMENGPFRTAGDLMNVSGIGEKKMEAILDLITTGG